MSECSNCKNAVYKVSLHLQNIKSAERIKHVTENVLQVLLQESGYSKFQCELITDDLRDRLFDRSVNSQLIYSGTSDSATKIMERLADREIITYLTTTSIK